MNLLPAAEYRRIIAEKIPEGLVIPLHDEFGHRYQHVPTGMTVRSVTTKAGILDSPHLKMWAAGTTVEFIDKNWEVIVSADKQQREGLFKQARMVHQDVFRDAGNIGTQGHEAVERYLLDWMLNGKPRADIRQFIDGKDGRLFAIARSAEQFCKDFDAEPVASELLVASVKHKVAGTLDGMMIVSKVIKKGDESVRTLDGEPCHHPTWWQLSTRDNHLRECRDCGKRVRRILALIDWKTSNSIDKPEYAMQVSAYWYAFAEMTGIKPEEILIVRLDKDRCKYEVRCVTNRVRAFSAYKHTAAVYDWLTDRKDKLLAYPGRERVQVGNIEYQAL